MNNEMSKLENVRKSCKTTATVVNVIKILLTVCMIMCFVASIICFANSSKIDEEILKHPEAMENTTASISFMNATVIDIDNIDAIGGHYGIYFGVLCLTAGIALIFAVILFSAIKKIFVTILENDSPFSDEVISKIKVCFIVATIFATLTVGLGAGVATGLVAWCIYCIFQYGHELQNQADETL